MWYIQFIIKLNKSKKFIKLGIPSYIIDEKENLKQMENLKRKKQKKRSKEKLERMVVEKRILVQRENEK